MLKEVNYFKYFWKQTVNCEFYEWLLSKTLTLINFKSYIILLPTDY